jgi:hypothetical protein
LFGLFWYEDLLVDPLQSDLDTIRSIIEDEVRHQRIYWPKIHGRDLYDRYAIEFRAERDSISGDDTLRLLDGTPVGVYQVGRYVTGPLGIIESYASRHFPPQMELGLWHCPMLDCGTLHDVRIVPSPIPLVEAFAQISKVAAYLWPTPSRWQYQVISIDYSRAESWRAYSDIPLFIGDCIVGDERTKLVARALASPYGDRIRELVDSKASRKRLGSAETVAAGLNEDEQLQLLLAIPDQELTSFIDALVWSGQIAVPVAEIREVDSTKRAILDTTPSMRLQLSSLGIRAQRQNAILALRHLLLKAHSADGDISDLNWRLRKTHGQSTQDALMAYFRRAQPLNVIDTLILASQRVTKEIATALETTIEVPDERWRDVIAWKLGFDLPREDRRHSAIHHVLDNLYETLLRVAVPKGDVDRQAIRAAAVNAFVELEGLLDEIVSYVVWVLQSDHPKVTHFVYSRSAASMCVGEALGEELRSGSTTVKWSPAGNTLGTSVRYFQRLKEWLTELPLADRSTLMRKEDEVHELSSDNPRVFPFRHVRLWADASPDALSRIGAAVAACANVLAAVDVASVRNGLEHYREPERFPSTDRILEMVAAARSFITSARTHGLIPNLYWLSGDSTDAFGQRVVTLVDYTNDVQLLHAPRTIVGLLPWRSVASSQPVLVAPGNLFDLPNADILFLVRQDSEYSRYWNGYPARADAILVVADDSADREQNLN